MRVFMKMSGVFCSIAILAMALASCAGDDNKSASRDAVVEDPELETAPVTENRNARKVLEGALRGLERQTAATGRMVADGLTGLWSEDPKQRDAIMVALLDYQLHGVNGGYLSEMITARGRAMVPLLRERLKKQPACEEEFEETCRERKERDPLIEEMIEVINIGEVLCFDLEKCLVRTARSMSSPPFRRVLDVTMKGDRPVTGLIKGTAKGASTVAGSVAGDKKALADLLDYDLGDKSDALVDEQISRLGKDAVSELDKAYLAPLVCHPAYGRICAVSREARNRRIERLLGAVEDGEIICADDSECESTK